MHFLKHAHGIKKFECFGDFSSDFDENVLQFIKQQTKLQFLFIGGMSEPLKDSIFIAHLNGIVDAILVSKTIKRLNLSVEIKVLKKSEFSRLFYKCLFKLKYLPLILNGIPIVNVLRDLGEMDDDIFIKQTISEDLMVSLVADEFPNTY